MTVVYWDGGAWVSLLPCTGCTRDPVNNRMSVVLDHFTEFALIDNRSVPMRMVYVPVVHSRSR